MTVISRGISPRLKRVGLRAGVAFLCASMVACASLLPKLEPPRISLASLRVERLTSEGARLALTFAIENPNDRGVRLDALDLSLSLSGTVVGSTTLDAPVLVAAQGTTLAQVTATTTTAAWTSALARIGRTLKISYDIAGTAIVNGRRIPITLTGERDVIELMGRAR